MVRIELKLPIASSLLNESIYEGLLYMIRNVDAVGFNVRNVTVDNDVFTKIFNKLKTQVDIRTTGRNDIVPINKLLQCFNIKAEDHITNYSQLIETLRKNSNLLNIDRERINLSMKIERNAMLIDLDRREGIALQLFKADRYTGLTSIELDLSTEQLTLYFSKEAVLIALLGICSSFIIRSGEYYYFLFFSPEEIAFLLSRSSKELLDKYFIVKSKVIDELGRIISKTSLLSEVLLTDIMLSLEIYRLMRRENLDKISFLMFKLALEGATYKIYELTPITIYREPPFIKIAEKHYRDAYKLIDILYNHVFNPEGAVLKRLSTIGTYKIASEVGSLVHAMYGLYRFVVLGNPEGWYVFLRGIKDAYEASRNEEYLNLISRLPT
ncbi:MAG: hypothetical protein QXP91_11620 [Candidatus Methanomethylicia archaeon]